MGQSQKSRYSHSRSQNQRKESLGFGDDNPDAGLNNWDDSDEDQ